LARQRPAFPRLSSAARRAVGADIRHYGEIAERVRKVGGTTLRSIGQVAKLQTLEDNDESYVPPREMLRELMNDNKKVAAAMRKAHDICDKYEDVATASLLENFIDAAERRTWFLFEASRQEGGNEA
jgi:starvation-inducible DNA-binding protein